MPYLYAFFSVFGKTTLPMVKEKGLNIKIEIRQSDGGCEHA